MSDMKGSSQVQQRICAAWLLVGGVLEAAVLQQRCLRMWLAMRPAVLRTHALLASGSYGALTIGQLTVNGPG